MSGGGKRGVGLRRVLLPFGLGAVALGMVGMSYVAVPLYKMFCTVTGYGGTTRVAEAAPTEIRDTVVTVRFNGDTQSDLPWRFRPEQRSVDLRVGETALAYFEAVNESDRPVVGTATFNVTPQIAGAYFDKIECFCFTEQFLPPGGRADMPVQFYVDPAILDDPDTRDIRTITLSYMFFNAGDEAVKEYITAHGGDASDTKVN